MKKILPPVKKLISPKLFFPVLAVIAIIAIVAGVYFFSQYQKAQKLLNSPAQITNKEAQNVINDVGKLVELPSGSPTVATVSDIEKLKSQPFFKKAQNGDKVLIYPDEKKAIIWRPSTNKIIEFGSINLTDTSANPANPTPSVEAKVRVAIYNGTTTVGLTKTIQDSSLAKYKNIEVVARENAARSDYDKTYVIDLSGKNSAFANTLASELKGEVSAMPNGESKPTEDSDVLIILGASN